MNVMRVIRSCAVELAAVVWVTVVLAGCNASDQQDEQSPPAFERADKGGAEQPPDDAPPPLVAESEPGYAARVDSPGDETPAPVDPLPPLGAAGLPVVDPPVTDPPVVGPSAVAGALPDDPADAADARGNPLRGGGDPALRDSHTPLPEVTEPGKHGKEPYDPVKENGPIFTGWPKPKLALVITGRLEGYIEPCGCAGLEKMMGGMGRRHTFLKQLQAAEGQLVADKLLGKGWPVVVVDVGGTAKGHGKQAVTKFHNMVEGIKKMGYDAIALGKTDLKLPGLELLSDVAKMKGQPALFVSANVVLFDPSYMARFKVVQAGGMRIGITSVLGKKYQQQIRGEFVTMSDPETALKTVLPDLKQQADYLVLLAHATMEETAELKKKFPEFDVVVTADGAAEPPGRIEGTGLPLIEVGEKGKYAIVLGLYNDPNQPVRYQRVPLDSRFPGSKDMKTLMTLYQDQVKDNWADFAKQTIPHAQRELNGTFVGSKECGKCHDESFKVWRKSGHAKAYRTLAQLEPPRTFDPECISCHVVGWDTEGYFSYQGGYQSVDGMPKPDGTPTMKATPHLIDVGCESCHGPGSAHSKAENGNDKELQKKLQQAVKITMAEAQDPRLKKNHCYTCHDGDNSPDFKFETYWPKIEHWENED